MHASQEGRENANIDAVWGFIWKNLGLHQHGNPRPGVLRQGCGDDSCFAICCHNRGSAWTTNRRQRQGRSRSGLKTFPSSSTVSIPFSRCGTHLAIPIMPRGRADRSPRAFTWRYVHPLPVEGRIEARAPARVPRCAPRPPGGPAARRSTPCTGLAMEIAPMREALEPTQDSGWVLSHEGYNVLTESAVESALRARQWLSGHARRSLGQPRPDLGGLAGIHQMGILAALLRRRPVRHAQHRAAGARTGACRRLVPRAHPARRRTAAGARGRSARRHPQARHAPRPAAVSLDASHPCRHHRRQGASCAYCRWRTARRGCNSCGSRWTVTASTSGWRPVSRWPASAWSQCVWSRTSAPGARRAQARAWR